LPNLSDCPPASIIAFICLLPSTNWWYQRYSIIRRYDIITFDKFFINCNLKPFVINIRITLKQICYKFINGNIITKSISSELLPKISLISAKYNTFITFLLQLHPHGYRVGDLAIQHHLPKFLFSKWVLPL